MTTFEWAVLGFGIGLRHALDPDHLAAITAMLDREADVPRAMRLAAMWGLGHGASFVAIGLPIVLFDVRVPARFEPIASILVALLLIGLGVARLLATRRTGSPGETRSDVRPLVVGLAHGLAGSAALALVAATTVDSRIAAGGYLALVACGTLTGMVVATAALARPLAWTARREGVGRWIAVAAPSLLSIALGAMIGREAIVALV